MFLNQLNTQEKEAFYHLARKLALLDGINAAEASMLAAIQSELGIEAPQEDPADVETLCKRFQSDVSRRSAVLELLLLAKADGLIASEERDFARQIVDGFGLSADVLHRAEDWAEVMFSVFQTGQRFITAVEREAVSAR